LSGGGKCRATPTGFVIPLADKQTRHAEEIAALITFATLNDIGHQKIARAVAASSAFPPVFSPIPLAEKKSVHALTDGGVYDNSGVTYLEYLYDQKSKKGNVKSRLVIASDAGADFPTDLGGRYDTITDLGLRVIDTQRNRIAEADSRKAKAYFKELGVNFMHVSIHDSIDKLPMGFENHSKKVQSRLGPKQA
jgi:predicted acylesterase/phospholipase RssA